jgi:flagellar motility protein MotE (MotC chaperone)
MTPTLHPIAAAKPETKRGFRLLPILIIALGLVLTIRVGDLWQGLSIGVGSETQAQTDPAAAPAAEPAPAAADNQQAATDGTVPEEPVAEGEAPAADAAAPAPPADDPLDFTDEEVEVLQQLAKRREELELRARQLDEREAMVAAAEQRMEQKMAELRALQTTVEDLLVKRSEEEEATLQTLVLTYEKMKPKDAAQVFEEMDMDLLKDLVSRMKTSRAAPILALVSPTKVKELTLELAQKDALPFAP